MTVIARDIFSGDADSDIDGRVPDGGLDPATGIGAWDFVSAAGSTCCIAVVPGIGAQATLGNNKLHSHYILTGLTHTDEITVRATGDLGAHPDNWFSVLLNHSSGATTGYELRVWSDFLEIRLFTAGSGGAIQETDLVLAAGPHTIEFSRVGDQLYGSVDGVQKLAHNLDTVYDGIAPITGGDPGLCIANGTALIQQTAVTLFEVETYADANGDPAAPPLPAPCAAGPQGVYSSDCFQGAPTLLSLENRVPDGCEYDCLQQGRWHNVTMALTLTPAQSCRVLHKIGELRPALYQLNQTPTGEAWNHEACEDIPNLGDDYSVEIEGVFHEEFSTNFRYAWFSCLTRQQGPPGMGGHAVESGYEFLYDNIGSLIFMWFQNGVYHQTHFAPEQVPVVGDTYRIKLCSRGNVHCCYLNDVLQLVATDTRFPTGSPGICMMDSHETLLEKVTRWRCVSDLASAPGCGGPGGGGGGSDGLPTEPLVWPLGGGAWRPVPVPLDTATSRVRPYGSGAPRGSRITGVYSQGAWRALAEGGDWYDGPGGPYNGDPGNSITDPGCGQVPTGTLAVPPPGEKLFAAWELPFSGAVAPYDTGFNEMGGHTPGRLLEAQAAGLRLIGAQGGYGKFRGGNGMYSPAVMDAWIHGFADMDSFLMEMFDAGVFVGVSVADDIRNAKPLNGWPPSGLSASEVNRICGVWKAQHPWIRTLVRTHPSVLIDMGATPGSMPNLDATISQYAVHYGDISSWVQTESGLQASLGIPYNLWSLNYYEGDGRSGVRTEVREEIVRPRYFMAPSEILEYGSVLAVQPASLGIAGWKINQVMLNQPGFVDALIAVKTLMLAV